ncbi:MAG: tryptophan synthase subunit alpha [Bryobacteraceae bacterium]|nr:tryptophan synthase subunit alpha [Bryobacteraceae bacterium]
MTSITARLNDLRAQKRKALVAYVTAGDPHPDRTVELVLALERGGADIIELGVPFSDPIADGPTIQRGAERALAAGTTMRGVLRIASEIRTHSDVPLVLFTYLNPVLKYGLPALAKDAKASGIDGVLLTDLSVEEADRHLEALRAHDLDTVFLAAPTSSDRRLELVAKYSTGFVYLVSRAGVTGERDTLSGSAAPLVQRMRELTGLPLALGFGISTPQQAGEAAKLADAVVVGSALVRVVEQGGDGLEERLEAFTRGLKEGMK